MVSYVSKTQKPHKIALYGFIWFLEFFEAKTSHLILSTFLALKDNKQTTMCYNRDVDIFNLSFPLR